MRKKFLFFFPVLFVLLVANACNKVDPEAAAVFRVEDFGAVGDGVHDDAAAICEAVRQAVRNGGGTVVFEPKTYRMEETREYWFRFMIFDTQNITIEGNGARLLSTPTNQFFDIQRSRNIKIRNLTLDYSPLPYAQGIITAVDPAAGTLVFSPSEGTPAEILEYEWLQGPVAEHFQGWSHSIVMNPDFKSRKVTTGSDHYYITHAEKIGDRSFKLQIMERYWSKMDGISPGDGLVIGIGFHFDRPISEVKASRYPCAAKQGCNNIIQSEHIVFDGVKLYAAPARWVTISNNYGPITIRNCYFGPEPGTGHALSSIRDGIHAKHNREAVIIENNHFEATMDDLVACTQMEKLVVGMKSPDIIELRNYASVNYPPARGDELMFKCPAQGKMLGTARIKRVISETVNSHWIQLDRIISGLQTCAYKDWNTDRNACVAMNYSQVSSGFRICNNKFVPLLRRALAVTWCDGEISGNELDCKGGGMIDMVNDQQFHSGAFLRNVVVRDNVIRNSVRASITLGYMWTGGQAEPFAANVSILNNRIINQTGEHSGIKILNAKQVRLSGNQISQEDPAVPPIHIYRSEVEQ